MIAIITELLWCLGKDVCTLICLYAENCRCTNSNSNSSTISELCRFCLNKKHPFTGILLGTELDKWDLYSRDCGWFVILYFEPFQVINTLPRFHEAKKSHFLHFIRPGAGEQPMDVLRAQQKKYQERKVLCILGDRWLLYPENQQILLYFRESWVNASVLFLIRHPLSHMPLDDVLCSPLLHEVDFCMLKKKRTEPQHKIPHGLFYILVKFLPRRFGSSQKKLLPTKQIMSKILKAQPEMVIYLNDNHKQMSAGRNRSPWCSWVNVRF